jgi:16S rRNA (cytosine1402-N4)-methyltransferase
MHYPVLLRECLEFLAVRCDGTYIDATAGMGGHTGAIAASLTTGHVISADRDAESLKLAEANNPETKDRIRFVHASFSVLAETLQKLEVPQADGLLADLGVSRFQLTEPERGFSLMNDGPVDMRMDRSKGESASDLVNFDSEKSLADLIFEFGEERRARRIARAIVRARPIRSTLHLAKVIEEAAPRTGPLHPATRSFMALRMAVNGEPEQLTALLNSAPNLVKPGGRIVILTFMSLEDRQVKHAFQDLARAGRATILTKHVVRPDEQELRQNPPSRSAKLRAVEMK